MSIRKWKQTREQMAFISSAARYQTDAPPLPYQEPRSVHSDCLVMSNTTAVHIHIPSMYMENFNSYGFQPHVAFQNDSKINYSKKVPESGTYFSSRASFGLTFRCNRLRLDNYRKERCSKCLFLSKVAQHQPLNRSPLIL